MIRSLQRSRSTRQLAAVHTGPDVVTGSTRMKAGTAQKSRLPADLVGRPDLGRIAPGAAGSAGIDADRVGG